MREYTAECVGILEGHIDACDEIATLLKDAWIKHESQKRLTDNVKDRMRSKYRDEDDAYSAAKLTGTLSSPDEVVECLNQIRDVCREKSRIEIRYNLSDQTTQLSKRALENYQRTLNDLHHEMHKMMKDITQLKQARYGLSADIQQICESARACINRTSPLQIISGLD